MEDKIDKNEIFKWTDAGDYIASLQIFLNSNPNPPIDQDIQVYGILTSKDKLHIPSKLDEKIYKYILLFIYSHIRSSPTFDKKLPVVTSSNDKVNRVIKFLNDTNYMYLSKDKKENIHLEIESKNEHDDDLTLIEIIESMTEGHYMFPLFICRIYDLLINFNIISLDTIDLSERQSELIQPNEKHSTERSFRQIQPSLNTNFQNELDRIFDDIISDNRLSIPPITNITNSSSVGEVNPDFEVTVKAVLEYILTESKIIENTGPPYVFSGLKGYNLIVYTGNCDIEPYNLNICQVLNHIQNEYMGKGQYKDKIFISVDNNAPVPQYIGHHSEIVNAFFNKILEKNTGHWNKLSRTLNRRGLSRSQKAELKKRDVRYRLKYKRGRIPFWTKYGGKRKTSKSRRTKKNNYK